MGQFSWMASDNGEQIGSFHDKGKQVVTMVYLDKDGVQQVVTEDDYEGYGEFGGVDFYDAVAWMNPEWLADSTQENRELRGHGIDINFARPDTFPNMATLPPRKYPQLYLDGLMPQNFIDFTQEPESDPDQGWRVEKDYDDEW